MVLHGLVVLLCCVHGLHYGYTGLQCLLHYLLVHTKSLLMDIHGHTFSHELVHMHSMQLL